MNKQSVETFVQRIRVLRNKYRYEVLEFLYEQSGFEYSHGELCNILPEMEQDLSFALTDLVKLGVVRRRKNGKQRMYSVNKQNTVLLLQFIELTMQALPAEYRRKHAETAANV